MAETQYIENDNSLLVTSLVCPEWPDLECTFALSNCWKPVKFVRVVDKAVPPPVDFKRAIIKVHRWRTRNPNYFRFMTFKQRQFLDDEQLEEYNSLAEPLEYKHCLEDGPTGYSDIPEDNIVSLFDETNMMAFNAKMVASPVQILTAIYETYVFAETHLDCPEAPELSRSIWTDKIISEIPMANHTCQSASYNVQKEILRRLNVGYRYKNNPEPFLPLPNQPALLAAIGPVGRTRLYFARWAISQPLIPLENMRQCVSSKAVRRHYRISNEDTILRKEGLESVLFHRAVADSQTRPVT